jgi:hypothetical protein
MKRRTTKRPERAMMHFLKFGRSYQLRVAGADDLAHVPELDESLWVATSAPNVAFRCDPALLQHLDSDANGRIYTNEVKQAVRWLQAALADFAGLGREDTVALDALRADTPVGQSLRRSCRFVLDSLQVDDNKITLDQVRRLVAERRRQPLNGDGVLVPEAAADAATRDLLRDIIACTGGADDCSGAKGVNTELFEAFCADVDSYLAWLEVGRLPAGAGPAPAKPFGEATEQMHALLSRHRAAVDHFFELCLLRQFQANEAAGGKSAELPAMTDAAAVHAYLLTMPIAVPVARAELPLEADRLNPAYREWVEALVPTVLQPVLGHAAGGVLTLADWRRVKQALAPFDAYAAARQGDRVAGLPEAKLQAYRDAGLRESVAALIRADREVGTLLNSVRDVEKLLLYQRHLPRLLNNFVNFGQLYATDERALFEMGSVVLDGRWFNFAVAVADINQHAEIAKAGNIFTMYIEITGQPAMQPFTIAVPATSGAKGNLVVGKQGVFFDIDGKEYDARIVRILENPISVREALVAPFVRLWDFVMGKIEKMAGASEKELQKTTDTLITAPPAAAAPAAAPVGLLMGLSVSVAALGSALAFMTKTLADMGWARALGGLLGALAALSAPVLLLAFLKLRRQDFSSLLEGCGWAINVRMRPDRPQRRQFTCGVPYPADATGIPRRRWWLLLTGTALAAFGVWLAARWLGALFVEQM